MVLNPQCLPTVAKSTNVSELQISSQEFQKITKCFVPLFFNESINSKLTPFQSVLQNIKKSLRVLIQKVNFVTIWLKGSIFEPIANKL